MKDAVDFLPTDKHKRFLQIDKKQVNDEVKFLHADRHESFLEIDTMIVDGDGEAFPEFPK